MRTLDVFVTGQKAFGAAVAEAVVAAGHRLVGVASPAYADEHIGAAFGDEGMRLDRLHAYAYRTRTPWQEAALMTHARVPEVDVIIAAHSFAFVGRKTREKARLAAIGYHPSLLPLHRGRDSVRWTIRDGDKVAGGSVYHLTDNVDGGPLAAQDYVFVPPGSTPMELWREQLSPLGVRLLAKVLGDLAAGRFVAVAQDGRCATWEPGWERPPIHRPELLELTAYPDAGEILVDPSALRG